MEWTRSNFSRRKYTITDPRLDTAKHIEVIVRVDGQTLIQMACREPGMLAIVSRPEEPGIDVEIVEPRGARYLDQAVPGDTRDDVAEWQFGALGL